MGFDEELRHLKEWAFKLVVGVFSPLFTPTQYTLIGFVFGLCCVYACSTGHVLLASTLWWINRFFDGLDGVVARYTKQQSDLGGYVDIVCDFTVYALVPIGVVHSVWTTHGDSSVWYALSLMEASFFVNAASLLMLGSLLDKLRSQEETKKRFTSVEMPRGLIEGFETMVFFQLFIAMPHRCTELMALFAAGVWLTVALRMRTAIQLLK